MDLSSASELADLRQAIKDAPASNESFEGLSNDEKLTQLGSRVGDITSEIPGFNKNFRNFTGTFAAKDDLEVTLKVDVYYAYAPEGAPLGDAHCIDATWRVGKSNIMGESVSEAFMRDHTPEEVTVMFNRLEETVTAAEELHSRSSAPTS